MELKLFAEFVDALQDTEYGDFRFSILAMRTFNTYPIENPDQNILNQLGYDMDFKKDWLDFLEAILKRENMIVSFETKNSFQVLNGKCNMVQRISTDGTITDICEDEAAIAEVVIPIKSVPKYERIKIPMGAEQFFEMLSGMDFNMIMKCPNCGKIFVNVTKRHMIYCSRKCRSHYAVKKQRGQV